MFYHTHGCESVAERFGDVLRRSLKSAYGRLPSAAFVAREFNLRCTQGFSVSNETARRWIRGCTLPDASRLSVFADWLDFDYNNVFYPTKSREIFPQHRLAIRTQSA